MSALDRTDREILRLLANDARRSNKQLAAAVGLAPSSCLERVRRLRVLGALRGEHAEIDPLAFGVGLEALLLVVCAKHSREVVDRFLAEVLEIPEVRRAYLVAGRYDFVVHVAVADVAHLRNLALDRFTSRPEVVRLETSVIYDQGAKAAYPDLTAEAAEGGRY